MKKVLVSDYDGTFKKNPINSHAIEINNNAIKRFVKKGHKFVLSTGRDYLSLFGELKKYNIVMSYISCGNGTAIFDNKLDLLLFNKISKNEMKLFKDFYSYFEYIKMLNPYGEEDIKNIIEFEIRYKDLKAREKFQKFLIENKIFNYYHDHKNPLIVHIFNNNSKKSDSIIFLANKEDIRYSDIFCIGDGYNDYDMIYMFNGYTVPTAKQELKQVALGEYENVSDLCDDILKGKVTKK